MACLACAGSARVNSTNCFDGSLPLIGSGRDKGRGFGFCAIRKKNNNCSFSCNKWKWKWSRNPLYYSLATPTSLLEQEAKSLVTEIGKENDNDVEADVDVDMDMDVNVVLKSPPKPVLRAAPSPAPSQKLERPDLVGARWAHSAPHKKANNAISGLGSKPPKKSKPLNNVWKKGNPTSYVPRVPASTPTTEISQEKENLYEEISQEKENLNEEISQEKKNLDEGIIKKEDISSMRMPILARPQPLRTRPKLQGKPMPMTMPTSSANVPAKKQVILKDLGAAPRQRQVILKDVGASLKPKQEITMKSLPVHEDVNVSVSATVAGIAAPLTPSRVGKTEGSGSPFRTKDKLKSRSGSALRKTKAQMSDVGEEEKELNVSSPRKGRKFHRAMRKAARVAAAKAEAPVKVEILEVGKQGMSVVELAHNLAVTEGEVLTSLFMKGIRACVTQTLDKEIVKLVCKEHDVEVIESDDVRVDYMAKKTEMLDDDDLHNLQTRPPILTIMGHVDHGKTTLLDYIRKSKVATSEYGGITQGIGAYTVFVPVDDNLKPCVFLDTPGHEAFSAMRARGAKVTDIAIIVVAADDGVRPQTNEAIAHAKAADVPIVVAMNKIDKEGASPERVMQELASIGLMPEEWGGDIPMVPVSARTGENVNELLETVMLVAELQELKANPDRNAKGTVIEASLHNSRGPLATFLVQNGTLKKGDIVVCGESYGKVRALLDDTGTSVAKASPCMAVQVIGLSNVPIAGDEFEVVNSLDIARKRAEECAFKLRDERLFAQPGEAQVTLSSLGIAITEGKGIGSNRHQFNIILKVDVQGSVAAIREALGTLPQDTVNLRFLMQAVGDINASDVNLASASEAIIVGFNVRVHAAAQAQAETQSVEIRLYRVIYELVDDIRKAMEGLLKPIEEQVPIGSAEVRAVFSNGSGYAAGCMVTEGKVVKGCGVRVVRNGKNVHTGTLDSLRRVKEVVKEISAGMECGIAVRDFNDWDVGDIIEAFTSVAKQCTLEEASATMAAAVAASGVQL